MTTEQMIIERERIRRAQLMQLIGQLNSVEGQINTLNTNLQNLKIEIKKHLLVDNLIVEEETYNKIVNNNKDVLSNINNAKSIVSGKL